MRHTRLPALAALAVILLPLTLQAATFPDVPSTHPFSVAIENLVEAGVISGNPDGTFRPEDPVNRAAMLKLLYLAEKRDLGAYKKCFPDVTPGAWYESFVCDAVAHKFVKGYEDGTFKPARPVSRAEALKMTITVMGIPLLSGEGVSGEIRAYTDVARDAWYAPYVATALRQGILPVTGQDGDTLQPDLPLSRGEAAAYIWNALQGGNAVSSSSSSAASAVEAASSAAASSEASSRKKTTFDDTGATADVLTMTFPFVDTQSFKGKSPFSYRFHVTSAFVADFKANLREGQRGEISCTLFRLGKDGFSSEYYLGFVDGQSCLLHTAVTPGDYQLQLQPTVEGSTYLVESSVGKGDGNDGFSQALTIQPGSTHTDVLDPNDLEDWYAFTVRQERDMKFSVTSAANLRCLIIPGDDVDLFGFDEPICNASYRYPVGTYRVGIGHAYPKEVKQAYTVELK